MSRSNVTSPVDLTADGVEVDHLPFFYEWTGSIDTTDVEVVLADARRRRDRPRPRDRRRRHH